MLKIGDNISNWDDLPYFAPAANTYYDSIQDPGKVVGDVAVVKTEIATGIYSHTAYVWNGEAWAAMDGNYNADNIYIDSEITLAGDYSAVGNYKKGETIAAGTNLSAILSKIFTKTLYPSKPTPSVSMSLTNAGSYEVGTSVTPSFSVTFDPKTYTYGSTTNTADESTTGVTPNGNATVTITGGSAASLTVTMSGNSGSASDAQFKVVDSTSYYGTSVSLGHTAGYMPVNNLNQGPNDDAEGKATLEAAQVQSGTATNNTDTSKITGFRYSFKYSGTDNTSAMNDAWIHDTVRAVDANKVKNAAIGSIAVAAGDKRVMFAVPGTSKTLKSVIDVDGIGLDIKDKFSSTTVSISAKNKGEDTTTYTLWYFENADGFKKTTMNVTFN
jgi:hypothetical protein